MAAQHPGRHRAAVFHHIPQLAAPPVHGLVAPARWICSGAPLACWTDRRDRNGSTASRPLPSRVIPSHSAACGAAGNDSAPAPWILQRRSADVLDGPARSQWQHSIPAVTEPRYSSHSAVCGAAGNDSAPAPGGAAIAAGALGTGGLPACWTDRRDRNGSTASRPSPSRGIPSHSAACGAAGNDSAPAPGGAAIAAGALGTGGLPACWTGRRDRNGSTPSRPVTEPRYSIKFRSLRRRR